MGTDAPSLSPCSSSPKIPTSGQVTTTFGRVRGRLSPQEHVACFVLRQFYLYELNYAAFRLLSMARPRAAASLLH